MSATLESRERIVRRQAKTLGLQVQRRSHVFELSDGTTPVVCGTLDTVEAWVAQRYERRPPGPRRRQPTPTAWQSPIDDYCRFLRSGGQRERTIWNRRKLLEIIARAMNGRSPAEVTSEHLVAWMGRQMHWKPETRRGYRSAARGFFGWAYRTGRVPVYLCDDLPSVRVPAPIARPLPDNVWIAALAAAPPRTALMLRLAAEAGLRRGEVAQVHTRDVVETAAGPQLMVANGKGGKARVLPISEALAAELCLGEAAHTEGAPTAGYLFPSRDQWGNLLAPHVSAHHVGKLAAAALPDGWSMHQLRHRYATRVYRLFAVDGGLVLSDFVSCR